MRPVTSTGVEYKNLFNLKRKINMWNDRSIIIICQLKGSKSLLPLVHLFYLLHFTNLFIFRFTLSQNNLFFIKCYTGFNFFFIPQSSISILPKYMDFSPCTFPLIIRLSFPHCC